MAHHTKSHGFSLVELSIVLVILGLLVGGILAGQSLIRASELRAVGTEYQRWLTAGNAFRDKYFAIPGDFSAATQFWGRLQLTNCATNSSAGVVTPGACDGNADGAIGGGGLAAAASETMQFWRHLALAGLIEGSYTGVNGAGGSDDSILAVNVPQSKLASSGWSLYPVNVQSGSGSYFDGSYKNALFFGGQTATTTTVGATLKAEEAWNIDTKLDDGMPGYGKVMAYRYATCTTAGSGNSSSLSATYLLSSTSTVCTLIMPRFF